MNPIALRLVISLVATVAVALAVNLFGDSFFVGLILTFAIITAALFLSPGAATTSSNKKATGVKPSSGSASSDQETGTVKWFNVKKGYGFITRDSGDDVFVHYRNIIGSGRRAIADGQRVQFIVIDGDKGLQADEVETI